MVDVEEEISSEELTITGDYSDYNILEEENDTMTKNDNVWVKRKQNMEKKSIVYSLQLKKRIVNIWKYNGKLHRNRKGLLLRMYHWITKKKKGLGAHTIVL